MEVVYESARVERGVLTSHRGLMALTESHQFCSSKFTTLRAIPA
jgi:hypothetical protein